MNFGMMTVAMAATAAAESVPVSPAVRSLGKIFKGGADGGVDGGGVDGGDDGPSRGPQSMQSVPYGQDCHSEPGPPSSQTPYWANLPPGHVSSHIEPTTLSGQSATLIRTHSIPTGFC